MASIWACKPSLILTDLTGDGIVLRAHEEHYEKLLDGVRKSDSEFKDIVQSSADYIIFTCGDFWKCYFVLRDIT